MLSKALRRLQVVMVKVPVWVVGAPSYIYCMLRALVSVRLALRSILRFFTGSRVARSCRSLVALVVAGVAMSSWTSSHWRSRALSM